MREGADENLSGQIIYLQHWSGARSLHRVILYSPDQKVAHTVDDNVPECHVTFGRGGIHNVL